LNIEIEKVEFVAVQPLCFHEGINGSSRNLDFIGVINFGICSCVKTYLKY